MWQASAAGKRAPHPTKPAHLSYLNEQWLNVALLN